MEALMDLTTLRAFEREVRKHIPTLRIAFKNESLLIRLIAFLVPFNPEFLTRNTATVFPTVYFPSRQAYETQPKSSLVALAHAFAHLIDTRDRPIRTRLTFAFPQVLAFALMVVYCTLAHSHAWIVSVAVGAYLIGCVGARHLLALFYVAVVGGMSVSSVLAIQQTHALSVLLIGAFVLLAPWPAAGRHRLVMRGYAMNLAITQWTHGVVPDFYRQGVTKVFLSVSYYFMSWGQRVNTSEEIDRIVSDAQRGVLQKQFPYDVVYGFLRKNNLLKPDAH
jgi:hypothetical protein